MIGTLRVNGKFYCFSFFAGTFEQSEFRQYLNGPPLEIEVHDRDRKPEEVKLKATLFGDDLEDEKISNVGTVASKLGFMSYSWRKAVMLELWLVS